MDVETNVEGRARVHAALGDPARLSVVDRLLLGDASPGELAARLGLPTNLLAHHLRVLEAAGVVERVRSERDGRRWYVRLLPAGLASLDPPVARPVSRVLFVCTHNSARSQLAAAAWSRASTVPCASAGTRPTSRVHLGALAAARRRGLRMGRPRTARLEDVARADDLVVAVCDTVHEELGGRLPQRLHWSVPDPVPRGTDDAFDAALDLIEARVTRLAATVVDPRS